MLQVREKSYSRLLKTHAPGIYLETRWYSFLRLPLDAIPVKEGFIPSVVVLLPVFPFTVFLAQIPTPVLSPPYRVPLQHILHVAQAFVQDRPIKSTDTCFDQTS